jgi:hypothetical protein
VTIPEIILEFVGINGDNPRSSRAREFLSAFFKSAAFHWPTTTELFEAAAYDILLHGLVTGCRQPFIDRTHDAVPLFRWLLGWAIAAHLPDGGKKSDLFGFLGSDTAHIFRALCAKVGAHTSGEINVAADSRRRHQHPQYRLVESAELRAELLLVAELLLFVSA